MRAFDRTHVEVSAETLARLGWKKVIAKREMSPKLLRYILKELRDPDSVRLWHWLAAEGKVAELENVLNHEKPGVEMQIFFYYGVTLTGEEILAGVGSISNQINPAFPFHGVPFLSGCYIAADFRHVRLYSALLLHRFNVCRAKWGDALLGVHFDSNNLRIAAAVQDRDFVLPFNYVGDETSLSADASTINRHFLWFSDRWRELLVSDLRFRSVSAPSTLRFLTLVESLLDNHFGANGYYLLQQLDQEIKSECGVSLLETGPLRIFTTLLNAIPIAVKAEPAPTIIVPNFQHRGYDALATLVYPAAS